MGQPEPVPLSYGPIFLQSLQKTLNRTQYPFFWFMLFTYSIAHPAFFFIIFLLVALSWLELSKYVKKRNGKVPGNDFLCAKESSKTDTITLI